MRLIQIAFLGLFISLSSVQFIQAQNVTKTRMQLGTPLQTKIGKNATELLKAPSIVLTSKNSFFLQYISTVEEVAVTKQQEDIINKELKSLELPALKATAKFKQLAEGDYTIPAYFPEYQWNTFLESIDTSQPILFNCLLVSYTESKQPQHFLIITGFNQ